MSLIEDNNHPDSDSGNSPGDTYKKNVALAAVYGISELTLRKQRAVNTIAHSIQEQFFLRNPELANAENISDVLTEDYVDKSGTVFEIPEETIMYSMGYKDKRKYYSYTQVLSLLKEISDQTIGFDALGVADRYNEEETWTGFTKFIGSAERKNGYFKISMPPPMIYKIVNPETSFQGRVDWTYYNSKNTPGIYETCEFYWQQGEYVTPWFTIEEIRTLTGAISTSYDDPKRLRQRVINVALKDINEQPLPLLIEAETTCMGQKLDEWKAKVSEGKKPGRKPTTHYRFAIKEKTGSIINTASLTNQIHLTSQKTELHGLGVAKNQIDGVFDECRDENGDLNFRYLRWCIQKGHELRKLSDHKLKSNDQFGGLFRKRIIRGKKENWFNIDNMITSYLKECDNHFDINKTEDVKRVKSLHNKLQSNIVGQYLNELSEFGHSHLREQFDQFLEKEFPHKYKDLIDGKFSASLDELIEVSGDSYYLHLFLELNYDLFVYDSFRLAMKRYLESES